MQNDAGPLKSPLHSPTFYRKPNGTGSSVPFGFSRRGQPFPWPSGAPPPVPWYPVQAGKFFVISRDSPPDTSFSSLSDERRTTVYRAIEHAAAASSSVGIRPGFLPPLPCSAILYGSANSKGSKGPELDGLQGREPRHSGSMLRDENEEARQFRPFRRVRISLLWLA